MTSFAGRDVRCLGYSHAPLINRHKILEQHKQKGFEVLQVLQVLQCDNSSFMQTIQNIIIYLLPNNLRPSY